MVLEARAHVALWFVIAGVSAAAGSWLAVWLWIGPLFATKVVHQLQNTGEHTEMPNDPDIFRNTRTLVGPPPMRWLMWNMSYHTAHHAFPGVPFHALPALHREIVDAATRGGDRARLLPGPAGDLRQPRAPRELTASHIPLIPAKAGARRAGAEGGRTSRPPLEGSRAGRPRSAARRRWVLRFRGYERGGSLSLLRSTGCISSGSPERGPIGRAGTV